MPGSASVLCAPAVRVAPEQVLRRTVPWVWFGPKSRGESLVIRLGDCTSPAGYLSSASASLGALTQKQLGGDHRCFRLAMHRPHRSAHKLHLVQRPLIGSKKPFVFPPPAIESSCRLDRQSLGILDVREQPHVHLMTLAVDADQCPRIGGFPSSPRFLASSGRSPHGSPPRECCLQCRTSRWRTCGSGRTSPLPS